MKTDINLGSIVHVFNVVFLAVPQHNQSSVVPNQQLQTDTNAAVQCNAVIIN